MKVHPAAELFPELYGKELEDLAEDIKKHGLRHPIVTYQGAILDGRNRFAACAFAGVKPAFVEWDGRGGSPVAFVVSVNIRRRHLDASQRAMLGAELLDLFKEEAKERQGRRTDISANLRGSDFGKAAEKAAATVSVAPRSLEHASKVHQQGTPELRRAVKEGEIAVSAAALVAKQPAAQQKEIVEKVRSGNAKNVQQAVRQVEQDRRVEAARKTPARTDCHVLVGDARKLILDLPARSVACVVTDSPYGLEVHNSRRNSKDYADGADYALELLRETSLELTRVCSPDAHLYFFSGYSYRHAFREVLREFFELQENDIVWGKDNHTVCDYSSWYPSKHEYVIFAKMRGSKRKLARCVPDLILQGRTRDSTHSAEKPVELLRTFIEQSTDAGELVLDPFAGSGSTGVAAAALKRRFLGFELEKKWADVARARLAEVRA